VTIALFPLFGGNGLVFCFFTVRLLALIIGVIEKEVGPKLVKHTTAKNTKKNFFKTLASRQKIAGASRRCSAQAAHLVQPGVRASS
jgi:hypothetical protein